MALDIIHRYYYVGKKKMYLWQIWPIDLMHTYYNTTTYVLQKGTYIVICNGYYIEYIFSGPDCNIPVSLNPAPSINDTRPITPEETDPGTIAGILIVIILGSIILFIVIYCKFYRRFKRMKTEMAHVHYIADPNVQPGKSYLKETILSEFFPSAVSISADFAAVRFIFLDKIRYVWYEKLATMLIFYKKSCTQVNFIPHYKNRLVQFLGEDKTALCEKTALICSYSVV